MVCVAFINPSLRDQDLSLADVVISDFIGTDSSFLYETCACYKGEISDAGLGTA